MSSGTEWQIDGPKVLDVGDEHERVERLVVGVVGGRVDVVTHDDSPTARVEVTEVEGLPLRVRWDGGKLTVTHGKDSDTNVMDMIRRTIESFGRNKVVVSISVPQTTRVTVSTVSATALVSGVRQKVQANTVSGSMTLSDLEGDVDLNTVSGELECTDLDGDLTINAVSGAVTVQGGRLPRVDINTVSGDVALDLSTDTSRISSNSVSGDVTVRAPFSGFDVQGNTNSGQVVVDGRTLGRGERGFHPGKGGRLREGNEALRVTASAVSGSIVVLRANPRPPQDAPYAPPDADRPTPHGSSPDNTRSDTTAIPHDATGVLPTDTPQDAPTPSAAEPQHHPQGHPQDHPHDHQQGWASHASTEDAR